MLGMVKNANRKSSASECGTNGLMLQAQKQVGVLAFNLPPRTQNLREVMAYGRGCGSSFAGFASLPCITSRALDWRRVAHLPMPLASQAPRAAEGCRRSIPAC